jgi:hypothetical protein
MVLGILSRQRESPHRDKHEEEFAQREECVNRSQQRQAPCTPRRRKKYAASPTSIAASGDQGDIIKVI